MTGTELRAQRLARGLTQRELAELNGVHVSTVSTWERGLVSVPHWLRWPPGGEWRECWAEVTHANAKVGMTSWYACVEIPIESDAPGVGSIVQRRWQEAT